MYYQDFELEFMAFLNKLWFVYSFFNKLYGFYFVTVCLWLFNKLNGFYLIELGLFLWLLFMAFLVKIMVFCLVKFVDFINKIYGINTI